MKQSVKPIAMIVVLATAVVMFFQNCSDPLGTNGDQSSFTTNLPFAYDTRLDTIAYMSCAGGDSAADQNAIWTFRAGAFAPNQGVVLRRAFLDLTSNFSTSQRAEALGQSDANSNAVLQLSIRPADSLQDVLTSGGRAPVAGSDFARVIGPLDDSPIASKLAAANMADPARINYFAGISGLQGRTVEGAIRFNKDEGEANSVRGFLAGTALLTTTYSSGLMPNKDARGPAGITAGTAYGRGYKIQFNYPPGESVARSLSAITELDLETGRTVSDASQWYCPAEYQFRIARSCGECVCASDAGDPGQIATVRRVLKTEHWYISMDQRCIVQKSGSQQCYPAGSAGNYHFASVCVR